MALNETAQRLETELVEAGWPAEERSFRPHITVGKLDRSQKPIRTLRSMFQEWISSFRSSSFSVATLSLVESRLTPSGSVYTRRAEFPFRHA
jgi:2'-5' RNA ligase